MDNIIIEELGLTPAQRQELATDLIIVKNYIITCATPLVGTIKIYNRNIIKKIAVDGVGCYSCNIKMTKTRLTDFVLVLRISDPVGGLAVYLTGTYADIDSLTVDLDYVLDSIYTEPVTEEIPEVL